MTRFTTRELFQTVTVVSVGLAMIGVAFRLRESPDVFWAKVVAGGLVGGGGVVVGAGVANLFQRSTLVIVVVGAGVGVAAMYFLLR